MNFPDELRTERFELIDLAAGGLASVAKTSPAFPKWYGPAPGDTWADTFGNKPMLDFDGEPVFAEIYTLRLLKSAGWDGVWVNSFRNKYMTSYSPLIEGAVPPAQLNLLTRITGSGRFPRGCWDVFAWQADQVLFAECKLFPDVMRASQFLWLEKSLAQHVKVESFLIVDWSLIEAPEKSDDATLAI